MSDPTVFDALLGYMRFGRAEAETLVSLGPYLEPCFDGIIEDFYEAIGAHPRARAVFKGGEAQIARQKSKLRRWLEELFGGVYDRAYFTERAKIGRMHVQIELPQHYMFSAMNIVRSGLHRAVVDLVPETDHARAHVAIDRICDIELAIMLETYRERFVEQQRGRERLSTLGQLAASVGHELRNPLAVMSTSLHLLRGRVSGDPRAQRHVDKLERQVKLAERIVTDLLSMVRDRPPQRERVSLAELVDEIREGLPELERAALAVEIAPQVAVVSVDRLQVRQCVSNLLANAVQSIDGRGEGRITLRAAAEGSALRVEVMDDGPGFDPDILQRAFEPLTTTRDTGVGLGLALCKRIITGHGGELFARNLPEGGAQVGFTLPDAVIDPATEAPPS